MCLLITNLKSIRANSLNNWELQIFEVTINQLVDGPCIYSICDRNDKVVRLYF